MSKVFWYDTLFPVSEYQTFALVYISVAEQEA
jgi:hypothetical protein